MAAMAAFLLAVQLVANLSPAAADCRVPAIYIFGDSTADVGNNNYLPGDGKVNFQPYGVDYPGSVPTGRFCNGYVGVDFLAKRLGFPESPPAALSVGTVNQELRGVNYASGGSGVLDRTGANASISMNAQIGLFNKTAGRLTGARGKLFGNLILSRSLFVFSTFNNDLFELLRSTPAAATDGSLQDQYISNLTTLFGQQLRIVYNLGARKMIVFGTGRLGCPPLLRTLSPAGDCLEVLNALSRKLNIAMKKRMRGLGSRLKGLKYSYVNAYDIVGTIFDRPEEFGFLELKSACCGGGFPNAVTKCSPNSSYCSDRNSYFSWDAVHPTEAAYRKIADLAYSGLPAFVEPVSLDDLVRWP